jgi:hypothetical protein
LAQVNKDNIIRQALQHRTTALKNNPPSDEGKSQLQATEYLHDLSRSRYIKYLDKVLDIVKRQSDGPLFSYDSVFAADPLFFACVMLAESGGKEEDFEMCLKAMNRTRWAFAKLEDRTKVLRTIWDSRYERILSGLVQDANTDCNVHSQTGSGLGSSYSQIDGVVLDSGKESEENFDAELFNFDTCSRSSAPESPILPASESSNSPISFNLEGQFAGQHEMIQNALDIDQMEMETSDILLGAHQFKQCIGLAKETQGQQLHSMVFSECSGDFSLQSLTDMPDCTDFLLPPGTLDGGDVTPRNFSTCEEYINNDFFLQ